VTALTHSSFVNESGAHGESNQRLEYLGDAVLGLVVGETLYRLCPGLHEGDLTRKRAAIVREETLAQVAARLELGKHLRVGAGAASTGDSDRPRVLASGVEALVGALYVLKGLRYARGIVRRWLGPEINRIVRETQHDPKSLLQERMQQKGSAEVSYSVEREDGPPHDRTFEVSVWCEGRRLGSGRGKTKKRAEQAAAQQALLNHDQEEKPGRQTPFRKGPDSTGDGL
jgi:ribonuclease-3